MSLAFLAIIAGVAGTLFIIKQLGADKAVDWIHDWIANILRGRILPAPLTFALFIFIIANVAFIFPLIFNMIGYHCDTNRVLYNIPLIRIFDNLNFAFKEFAARESTTEDLLIINYSNPNIGSGIVGSGNCLNRTLVSCTNCTPDGDCGNFFDRGYCKCVSDGYRRTSFGYYTYASQCWGGCAPPIGYYYDYQSDVYVCYNSTYCDLSNKESEFNEELSFAGNPVEQSTSSGVKNLIGMGCFKYTRDPDDLTYAPQLALFGRVPLFDSYMWVLIGVIMIIVGLGSIIKR